MYIVFRRYIVTLSFPTWYDSASGTLNMMKLRSGKMVRANAAIRMETHKC